MDDDQPEDSNIRASTSPHSNSLSLFSAINLVAASMIGAGVYTTSGFTLADLGTPTRVVIAWIVGGVIALSGAVSYGALASRFTLSGGEYVYLSRAIHPALGYVAGFVSILAGFTGATAFAATALESYLPAWPLFASFPAGVIASLVIALAAILHSVYARYGLPIQNALMVIKFLLLAAFFVVALLNYPERWRSLETISDVPPFSLSAFAVSLMWISLSYSGFNAAIYVASEVRRPEVNVAKSLWMATLLVGVIYVALNTIFVFAPARQDVIGQKDVAVIAARSIAGPGFESLIRGVLLASLATSVSAMMMSGPRVVAKMADDGALPSWFRFHNHAPTLAIFAQAALAIAVVQVSTLQRLLSYLGFTLSVSSALTVATIFWLRFRGDKIAVPWYPLPPLLFVAGTVMIAAIAGFKQPVECLAGLVTLLVGLVVYRCTHRQQRTT